ncbi:Leucine-rich repeat-containing protein 34 [Durusdinium trenchii]|uniref:Leucine-rich repeat-containing protein 34 n=1 Tax=Durusdinium trenchii TaxID=1381693 RepID=A0ABP0N2C0_9DINO
MALPLSMQLAPYTCPRPLELLQVLLGHSALTKDRQFTFLSSLRGLVRKDLGCAAGDATGFESSYKDVREKALAHYQRSTASWKTQGPHLAGSSNFCIATQAAKSKFAHRATEAAESAPTAIELGRKKEQVKEDELSEMLKKNTTLESFDLRNNKIDVECLEALAKAMSQNDNIKQLYIFEAKASMKRQPSGVCSIATTSTARSNRSIASYKRKPTAEDQETMQKRFAQWFSNTFTWTSTIGTKGTGEDVAQDSEKEPVEEAENVVKFLRCCGQQWPEDGLKLDEVFLKTVQAIEGQESAEGTSRMSKMLRKLSEVIINQEQRTLVLAHMLLGDEEAKELAQAVGGLLKLSKVQVINLYGNGDIGFRGLQALAKAVSNNNDIKKLYIFREAKDSHGQPSPNVGEVVSEDRLVAFMRQCGRALLQGQCKSVKTGTNSVVPRRSRLSQTSMTANGGGLILGDVFSKVIQAIESQEASAVQQAPCNNAVRFTDTSDPMRKESEVRTPQMSKMLRKLSEVIINQENQLNLSSMDLTDEEAEVLAQAVRGLLNISDIRVIDLRNNKISVSGLEALAKALSKHATVQELYIVSDDIQGGNEKEVNKSLLALMRKWGRALHHQETTLSSVLKEVFATAIKKETLLDLKKMHLNDKDVEELAPLLPRVLQCKVQVIDLRNNDMGLDGFKALAKASVNDELLKGLLIFSSDSQGNQEEKEALLALMRKWGAVLQSQDRLKQEETKLNKVFSKVFEATMKKAEVLDLSKMGLSNVEAQALAEGVLGLLKISNVQFIDLRSSEIGLYGFEALAKAFSMNFTLKRLKIFSPDGEGNEEASGVLLNFMRQCGTALLNQDRFKLGNICLDVMKALEGQEQNGKVLKALQMLGKAIAHQEKTLSLNAMKLDLEETKAVVEAMYLHLTLEELWLRGCGLGDEGVKAVAKALERKSALRRLDVDENGIGDEGTEALVNALEVNTTLEMLYIGRNRGISAQGRQELEMVRKKKLAHGQDFRWF